MAGISKVTIQRDENGNYKSVELLFGPHYFVDIVKEGGKVTFILGATHHGFKADASEVGGELERFIYEIRERHSDNLID